MRAGPAAGTNDALVDALKRRHRYHEWCGSRKTDESLFVDGVYWTGDELPAWQLERAQPFSFRGWPPMTQCVWTRSSREAALRVDAFECSSLEHAHAFLLRTIGELMSPLVGRDPGSPIGDILFTDGKGGAFVFARGNVVLSARRAGRHPVEVEPLAHRLDDWLIAPPEVVAREAGPSFERLEAARSGRRAGERVLHVETSDRHGRPVSRRLFSRSGEIVRDRGRLRYRAERPGWQEVTAYAVAGRAMARRVIRFEAG